MCSADRNAAGESAFPGIGTIWFGSMAPVMRMPLWRIVRSRFRSPTTRRCSFQTKDAAGNWIDYQAAVSGDLQLCPIGPAHQALSDDYGKMLGDGMLLDDAESFEELIKRCAHIEARANKLATDDKKQS